MKDKFGSQEVMALLEDLRGEFRSVSEVVLPLRDDMGEVKERLGTLETEVRSLKDAVGLSIPSLAKRVGRLESLVKKG